MRSIKQKFLLSFVLSVSAVMILAAALGYTMMREVMRSVYQTRSEQSFQAVNIEIDQQRERFVAQLGRIAAMPDLRQVASSRDSRTALARLDEVRLLMFADTCTLATADGVVIARAHDPGRSGDRVDLTVDPLNQAVLISERDGVVIRATCPIKQDGQIVGYLRCTKALDHRFVSDLRAQHGTDISVFDGDRLQATSITSTPVVVSVSERLGALHELNGHVQELSAGGINHFSYVKAIRRGDGTAVGAIVLTIPDTDYAVVMATVYQLFIGLAILLLALTAVLSYFHAGSIARPLEHLADVTDTIAAGDLTAAARVDSDDEVGHLAQRLNQMTRNLRESTTSIDSLNREIQQREAAELELRLSEENLRITLQSIGDGVIATDTDGRITRMNGVAEALTGWPIADARGQSLPDVFRVIHEDTREELPNPALQVLATREVVLLSNHALLLARDGSEWHVADSAAPINNEAGELVGVVLVFRDVTERKRLESTMQENQKMESLGRLAGGVAHDFNNMLTGILGSAEVLRARIKDPRQSKYVDIIFNAAVGASNLTNKLLAFSRKGHKISTPIDVSKPLSEAVVMMQHTVDKRITVHYEFRDDATIIGDPSQLQNAVINLAVNAVDAMPDGGDLWIRSKSVELDREFCQDQPFELDPGHYVQIDVEDSGTGIDPDILPSIFEPFFTTKEVGKGTGLGLAAVYGIVVEHHGAVRVASKLGSGTTFTIYLPLSSESIIKAAADGAMVAGTGCILVIDDESMLREMAQTILEELGYSVLVAADGREGLAVYEANHATIDLVLLDIVMPVMNGRECFEAIRRFDPNATVVIASGFADSVRVRDLEDQGLSGFIAKPFTYSELSRVIGKILTKDNREVSH